MQKVVEATRPSHVFSGHWHERETATAPGTPAALHVLDREGRGKPGLDTKALAVEPPIRPRRRRSRGLDTRGGRTSKYCYQTVTTPSRVPDEGAQHRRAAAPRAVLPSFKFDSPSKRAIFQRWADPVDSA